MGIEQNLGFFYLGAKARKRPQQPAKQATCAVCRMRGDAWPKLDLLMVTRDRAIEENKPGFGYFAFISWLSYKLQITLLRVLC